MNTGNWMTVTTLAEFHLRILLLSFLPLPLFCFYDSHLVSDNQLRAVAFRPAVKVVDAFRRWIEVKCRSPFGNKKPEAIKGAIPVETTQTSAPYGVEMDNAGHAQHELDSDDEDID